MPAPQNGTVPPRQVPHAERRPREYLTPKEVEHLIAAPGRTDTGTGDAAMILVAYRHTVVDRKQNEPASCCASP